MGEVPETGDRKKLLQEAVSAIGRLKGRLAEYEQAENDPIAIIGAGCRFPGGVNSLESYWKLLEEQRCAVTRVTPERWKLVGASNVDQEFYSGQLDDIDAFDAAFFGISPREAATLDPQQRLVLEVGWEALEHAGQAPAKLSGSQTGVFIGVSTSDYGEAVRQGNKFLDVYAATGTAHNAVPGRLSYVLGLQGPSVAVDTACSSSLVAIHLACQSLRTRESSMVVAGGVNVLFDPRYFECLNNWGMMAPDGLCKTFDSRANGFVRSDGCGLVVLKRLSDAIASGDNVLALIRALVVNQDGRSSGLTVPNGVAQQALLRTALERAKLKPVDIQYVEAHGTGTKLGDPIEVEALATVLGQGRNEDQPLYLGSVKTNLGHMEAAAGVGGLLKTVLAMQRGVIPAHLHFREWNPDMHRTNAALRVPTSPAAWPETEIRRAGVSSFGFSGTNAHVLVEQAPSLPAGEPLPDRPAHLLTVSAANAEAASELLGRYEDYLQANRELRVADICFSATTGRSHLPYRVALQGASAPALIEQIRLARREGRPAQAIKGTPRVAFLFTGQGSHYEGMAKQLAATQPVFRAALNRCSAILQPLLDTDLDSLLFGHSASKLAQTRYAQPALFALEYALCEMWRSWGVQPSFVMGHSLGEYVAACVAGVFSLEAGLTLVAKRGSSMQNLPEGGRMASISASETEVRAALCDLPQAGIAAVNGPESIVISGAGADVEAAVERLTMAGKRCQFLNVSHAFHSPLIEPMLKDLERYAAESPHSEPRAALVSNLTGEIAAPGSLSPGYWSRHAREAVQFQRSVETLRAAGATALLEIGPGSTLIGLAGECIGDRKILMASTLHPKKEDWVQVLSTVASLYESGADIQWTEFEKPSACRRVPLPLTPWRRQRYWPAISRTLTTTATAGVLTKRRIQSPSLNGEVYEFELPADHPTLADHIVNGEILCPLTGLLQLLDEAGLSVEAFRVRDPLVIQAGGTAVIQVTAAGGEAGIHSLQDGQWVRHADGRIVPPNAAVGPVECLSDVQKRMGPAGEIGDFYGRMRKRGVAYGLSYQRLRSIAFAAENEALGQMEGGADTAVILDVALQALFPLLERARVSGLLLPAGIGSVRIRSRNLGGTLWSHVRLTSVEPDSITANIDLFADDGELLCQMQSFEARRAGMGRSLLHEVVWSAAPELGTPGTAGGTWLLLGAPDGAAARVAGLLQEAGCEALTVAPSEITAELLDTRPWRGIVVVAALDTPGATAPEEAVRAGVGPLFRLASALRASGTAARVWLVTRCGQAVEGSTVDPSQAAVWGAGRCLLLEHPETRCSLVDLDPSSDQALLIRELLAGPPETLVAHRNGHRFVPRLTAWTHPAEPRKLTITTPGILDTLQPVPAERRTPAEDEIEVRVLATGLNFRDVLSALGMIPPQASSTGPVFGAECAGIVERTGRNVRDFRPGDEVMLFSGGSFATHVTVNAAMVAAKPPSLTFAEAAALPVAYLTCMYGLETLAQMKPGETLLVHAAAGGVGVAATELARRAGVAVIATAGSEEKRRYLREHGIEHVFDSRSAEFAEQVLEATGGRCADIVLNSLSGDMIEAGFRCLGPYGRFVELGKRGIWTETQVAALRPDVKYFPFDFGERAWADLDMPRRLFAELNRRLQAGELSALPIAVFGFDRAPDAFRTMAQARHVGKLVVAQSGRATAHTAQVSASGVYLITGGLGALGLQTAEWLARKGAKSIVLAGRKAPTHEASMVIERLRNAGVRTEIRSVDVADEDGVDRMIRGVRDTVGPLRGVFHAAGVIDDGMAADQSWERVWKTMAPKVAGVENLSRATRPDPLDFFVLFSSASAILGSPGQAGYAAGNAYLDGVAQARRQAGLPALSVNWGGWASAGMAAQLDGRQLERWRSSGVEPIDPADAFAAFDAALDATGPQLTAVSVDWNLFGQDAGLRPDAAFFGDLLQKRGSEAGSKVELLAQLHAACGGERKSILDDFLRSQVRHVLALPATSALEDDQPLQVLGLDSVMAVELRTLIDRSTGVRLPVGNLLNNATVDSLSGEILAKLPLSAVEESAAAAGDSIDRLVDAIPDADVDQMLKQLMAGAE
jgi:acyl transferase domain-containing protein